MGTGSRLLAVAFRELRTWNVAAQFAVKWHWQGDAIKPLARILRRRQEPALGTMAPHTLVHLLTIRFDGSIELREAVPIKDVKGKLFRAYPGDVVFSKIDVRNGAIGIAPDDIENMCVTSEFPVYEVDGENANPDYVKLLFRTGAFKKLLNSMISGASGRKRIQPSQLESVEVPIPPLPVQRKIVAYWEKAQASVLQSRKDQSRLVSELNEFMVRQTGKYKLLRQSRMFSACFSQAAQWDVKAGRAGVFKEANPSFIRLGDYTEECAETVKPWEFVAKKWPIYGVNNKAGVFLAAEQETAKFNAAYKRIEKDWFFHNPTRANVGSLGIVPEVPDDAITSPEYQVWRLTGGFQPQFMDLLLQTEYFLTLVSFNRVGGVKQRMYYANLAEVRLPLVPPHTQEEFVRRKESIAKRGWQADKCLVEAKECVEHLILGTLSVEEL